MDSLKSGGAGPSADAGRSAAATFVIPALLVLSFALRALVCLRSVENLDGITIPDDCFYTLHIARSIARGLGPMYGQHATNGFQPLFGFLMVPTFWIFHDPLSPVRVALVVGALADTVALWYLARLLRAATGRSLVVGVVMLLWAVSPYAISNATNGLETSLALALTLAAVSYFPRLIRPDAGARPFFVFGVLVGLAMFARVDAGLLLAAAALLAFPSLRKRGVATTLRLGLCTAAGVVVADLPWWTYSFHHTGLIYPVSGRAVRYISQAPVHHHPTLRNFYVPELREGFAAVIRNQWPTLVVLAAVCALLLIQKGTPGLRRLGAAIARHGLLVLFACVLFLAYTTYIFTEWFFFRYFYPLHAALLLVTGLALAEWLDGVADGAARARLAVIAAFLVCANVARREFRRIYLESDVTAIAAMNIGWWARTAYPDGTIIGCPQSGALGYIADNLIVVNLDGVVNQDAHEAMRQGRLFAYAKEAHVEYLLVWGDTMDLIRSESHDWRDDDVIHERDITEFQTTHKPWHVYRVRP
jgi:hypothetical protein